MSTRASSSRATRTARGQGGVRNRSGGADEGREDEGQHEEDWEEQSVDDDDLAEPVKKKARKAAKSKGKGKGKVSKKNEGKLAPLLDMPVEIFTEVAKHLDPLSLLHLSRSSKSFRQLFASRSSRGIWRAVKSAVDFPDLEADDLSDMAHIALMYDNTCNICAGPGGRARNINFGLRKRFCKDCFAKSLDNEGEIYRKRPQPEPHPFLHGCFFTTPRFDMITRERWVIPSDVAAINKKLHELQEKSGVACEESPVSIDDADTRERARRKQVERGRDEFKPEEKELAEFVKRRRALVAAVAADAKSLGRWEQMGADERRKARDDLMTQREEAIIAKLEEAGYDKQDLHAYGTEMYKLVFQPRALSTAIWNRISPSILAHVEANRNARLEREKAAREAAAQDLLRPYYNAMLAAQTAVGEAASLPPLAEFIHLPAVAQFWLDDPPAKLDDEAWAAAGPTILHEVKVETQGLEAAEDVN
ncbi:hypothetical protein JCM6882_002648 [Rhodosporidiobolus microsporus]